MVKGFYVKLTDFIDRVFKVRGMDFLVLFIYSIGLGFFVMFLQPNSFSEMLSLATFKMLLLNILPITVLVFLLYFISASPKLSILASYIFFSVFAIVNRTKVYYRNEPIVPSDFQLGVEGAMISVQSKYFPDMMSILLFVLFLVLHIFLISRVSRTDLHKAFRIGGVVAMLLFSYAVYGLVYVSDDVYDSLPVSGSSFNVLDVANSRGTVYYFIHNVKYTSVRVPENYDAREFNGIEYSHKEYDGPNAVVIMGEAFSDLSELPVFDFEDGLDPIENFKAISEDAVARGHIVTPTFGGGTADTEFTVLTGGLSFTSSPNNSYPFNSVTHDMSSIVRVFNSVGYHTRGFHPGFPWFYKRQSVYPNLGFQESIFVNGADEEKQKGGYYNEVVTYDDFIERMDKTVADGKRVFDYMVTIQNHGPYSFGKYGHIHPFSSSVLLDKSVEECLGSYFEGIYDMDRQLGRLIAHINASDEPFVVVYYGDHLPSLEGNEDSFIRIGYEVNHKTFENELRFYSTPYFIWANDAGKDYIDYKKVEGISGEFTMSSNYLGAYLLELIGLDDVDPYMVYANEMRKKLPVITAYYVYDGENSCGMLSYDGEYAEDFQKFWRWQYHRITSVF